MAAIPSKCDQGYILSADFYYQPVRINVVQSGNYILSSVDSPSIVSARLYQEHFHEYISIKELIVHIHDGCFKRQFKMIAELQSSVTYILIMGISVLISEGSYSILVSGPNNTTFNPISKS